MFSNMIFKNKRIKTAAQNKGYSLIELIFVMTLLVIFGLTTFTLVVSGSDAYQKIITKKNTNSELRIALSYVDMRIRQNDVKNGVRIEKCPIGNQNAIVTQEILDGKTYETWIYWDGGKLREALVLTGDPVSNETSFVIAEIDGFNAQYYGDKKSILIDVWHMQDAVKQNRSSFIFLKAAL